MNYDYHTTKSEKRTGIFDKDFIWKKIKTNDVLNFGESPERGKTIAWNEVEDKLYELSYQPILDTVKQVAEEGIKDYRDTEYYKRWRGEKGEEYCKERIERLENLYNSIKEKGFIKEIEGERPVCVEKTGEKLDGMTRAVVCHYLGIDEIEVKEFAFNWRDVSWEWLERKSKAREMSFGPNYYFIDYGKFVNIEQKLSGIYNENAVDRWGILKDLVGTGKKVLDLGCNEGFMSIKSAEHGNTVKGIDYRFLEGAWFNKLVFEKNLEKDLDVVFEQQDLETYTVDKEYDVCLLLNVIYHLKNKDALLKSIGKKCKKVIMQGNLRKIKEHDRYYGITADDMCEMIIKMGKTPQVIEWRDKPIVIGL